MHYLTNSDIRNINIILTSKRMEINNTWNRFINSFIWDNAIYTPTNNTIINICNFLNNLIS